MSLDLSHLGGWIDSPKDVESTMAKLPFPVFSDVWGPIKGTGIGKTIVLTDIVEKVAGSFKSRLQTVGDCTSMATALAVDIAKAIDIWVNKDFEEWIAETSTEEMYAGSRILIGKGQLGYGDGSVGAWLARFVNEYGALPRGIYDGIDTRVYSGNKARLWGRPDTGLPKLLLPHLKKHPIQITSLVTSYEQARDLIANGYAIAICSNLGFSNQRDKQGFAKPSGSWAHCMACIGLDDNPKRPGLLLQNCFDKETEILTEKGWYKFENLPKNINVATVNLSNMSLEYQLPSEYQKVLYNGNMLYFKGRTKDCLVTPDHNMVYLSKKDRDNNKDEFKIKKAKDLNTTDMFIKKVNHFIGKEIDTINICGNDINMDLWLEFLGFYLAEGWATIRKRDRLRTKKKKDGTKYQYISSETDGYCGICQNQNSTLEHMERVVELLPFKFSKKLLHGSDKHYQLLCYNSEFVEYLSQFGRCHEKFIPDYVFSLSVRQQQIISDTMMLGDGNKKGDRYTTNSIKLRDGFQRLSIQLGYTSDYSLLRKKGSVYKGVTANHDIFNVGRTSSIGKCGNQTIIKSGKSENIQYNDYVYCVTVPNHTVIIRRNGKMLITGQSWGVWNAGPKTYNQPDGSFWVEAEIVEKYMFSQKDSWALSGYTGFEPKKINTRIF